MVIRSSRLLAATLPSFIITQSSSFSLTVTVTTPPRHLTFFRMASSHSTPPSSHNTTTTTTTTTNDNNNNNNNNTQPNTNTNTNTNTDTTPASAIDFLTLCTRLKTTKRAGWVKRDVQNPESISDHMHRMALMALISSDFPALNRDKCVKMAIVHDIAEAIVGDITPCDGVPKTEKNRMEQEALDHMCKVLGGGSRAQEIHDLWMEYEENSSLEAKVVKDFDKIEMILQALEYEKEQGKDLEEFFQSTAGKFQTEIGKAWASEIVSRRAKH